MKSHRVLISGAGVAGPALAYWLDRFGFEPTLIERSPAFRAGGYMIDIWGVGYDMLERYGLLEATRQSGYVFDRVTFVDVRGNALAGFGGRVLRQALGDRFFSVPRGDLARMIYESIEGRVETLYGRSIRALRQDPDGVLVELSTGETQRFDLLVGADGLHSRVRELALGEEARFETYLGYVAASFVAEGYRPRDEGAYVSFARPGRQVSRYAMRGDRSAFLLVCSEAKRPDIPPHDCAAHKAWLRAKFGADPWETPAILARLETAEDIYFDAVSQIRMPRWSVGRVALVGDAAYCPSLLAGAGAAYAILGAYILAGELRSANGDFVRALPAYERRLYPYVARQQKQAANFASAFAPRTGLGLVARQCVVNLMNVPLVGLWLARRMFDDAFPAPHYT